MAHNRIKYYAIGVRCPGYEITKKVVNVSYVSKWKIAVQREAFKDDLHVF